MMIFALAELHLVEGFCPGAPVPGERGEFVNPLADKGDIRRAIESLFDVRVLKVRTQNRRGKPRRYRFKFGRTNAWKKAMVTLNAEHRIDFF